MRADADWIARQSRLRQARGPGLQRIAELLASAERAVPAMAAQCAAA
jgi:hypothetical protein